MIKKIMFIHIAAFMLYTGCGGNGQVKDDTAGFIDVYIEQDGRLINFIDNTAEIKKSQFRFVFTLRQPDGFLLNASFSPESYDAAAGGGGLETIPGFLNTGIAEELFNPEYTMFISSDSPNYWYYYSDSDSRFDSVTKEDDIIKCRRTISSVIDLDRNGEKKDTSRIIHDTIYIVIVRIEWNDNFTRMIEKSRRFLKIKLIP